MNPKSIILLIIFFQLFNSVYSQNTYSKVILDSHQNGIFAKSAIPTFDNNYIIIGSTLGSGFIIKVDSLGNPIWNKTFFKEVNVNSNIVFNDLIQNFDSTFTIVGGYYDENDNTGKALCMKLNVNGDTIWNKKFSFPGYSSIELLNIEHTLDTGYIMIGQAYSYTNNTVVYIAKADLSGNIVWSQIIKYGTNSIYSSSIKQIITGDFVFSGYYYDNISQNSNSFIINIDKNGIINYAKKLYKQGESVYASEIEPTETGYISFNYSYGKSLILSYDSLGNTKWIKSFESYGFDRMKKTYDNGLAIYFGDGSGCYLIITDSLFNIKWSKNIIFYIADIIETKDNEIIAIGNGPILGVKDLYPPDQIGLVKFDFIGNNNDCTYDINYNFNLSIDSIFESNITLSPIFGGSASSFTFLIDTTSLYTRDGCVDMTGKIDENIKHKYFQVFPNPANNTLSVYANSEGDSKAVINVYDLLGSKVLTLNDIKTSGKLNKQIDISSLTNGTYIIQIAINNSHYTGRFVKQ